MTAAGPGVPSGAGRVVVGISRRTGSPDALRWAVQEAALRTTTVHAVMAVRAPRPPTAPGGHPPAVSPTSGSELVDRLRGEAVARLEAELGGDLTVHGVLFDVVIGAPAKVLLAAAHGAALLVLDSPRTGDVTTLPRSWILPSVVFRASCPVVVMPRRGDPGKPRLGRLASIAEAAVEAAGRSGRPGVVGGPSTVRAGEPR